MFAVNVDIDIDIAPTVDGGSECVVYCGRMQQVSHSCKRLHYMPCLLEKGAAAISCC